MAAVVQVDVLAATLTCDTCFEVVVIDLQHTELDPLPIASFARAHIAPRVVSTVVRRLF